MGNARSQDGWGINLTTLEGLKLPILCLDARGEVDLALGDCFLDLLGKVLVGDARGGVPSGRRLESQAGGCLRLWLFRGLRSLCGCGDRGLFLTLSSNEPPLRVTRTIQGRLALV